MYPATETEPPKAVEASRGLNGAAVFLAVAQLEQREPAVADLAKLAKDEGADFIAGYHHKDFGKKRCVAYRDRHVTWEVHVGRAAGHER